jgi:hypothetical protein
LSESYLSSIVAATSDPTLSIADRIQRAASMAEQYVMAPRPLNVLSATPREIAAQSTAAMHFASLRAAATVARQDSSAAKTGYAGLAANDPRLLQAITSDKFKGSVFEGVGLEYGTFSYLRNQDRSFTSQNIVNAANDAKALGFSPRDKAAMLDHTTIDRYDPKARATNRALQEYQDKIENDDTLTDLHHKAKKAKAPEERKAIQTETKARRTELAKESGLTGRIEDKDNHPKAKAATERRKTAIEKKAEAKYDARADVRATSTPPTLKPNAAGSDLYKKFTSSPK